MKVLALLALFVVAVAAAPFDPEDLEELDKRFLVDIKSLMHKILDPLARLVSKDSTEHACELACKTGIHTLVHLPFVDLACAPACKELQHLGKIAG